MAMEFHIRNPFDHLMLHMPHRIEYYLYKRNNL